MSKLSDINEVGRISADDPIREDPYKQERLIEAWKTVNKKSYTMNQTKLQQWILKQKYFFLAPEYDGMTAWELAGIIIREGQDEINYQYTKVGHRKETNFNENEKI